jgi:hypothetical protein
MSGEGSMKTWGILVPSGTSTQGLKGYKVPEGIFIPVMGYESACTGLGTLFVDIMDAKTEERELSTLKEEMAVKT